MVNILGDDVVREWGLQSLPQSKQVEMADRIGKMLYEQILTAALDCLSEAEQAEFDLILDAEGATPGDVLSFLHARLPDFDRIVQEARTQLKAEILR
jgi:hypothetical protein